ncbi:MAG: TorF family putative porin [Halopseudomonas sp.]
MKLIWMAPACLMLSTVAQAVEVSSSVNFTNDYRLRGISQTAGDAAVQASMDLAFDNGIYGGLWGSNVDFGDDANLELDAYAGYAGSFTEDLSWDANLFYYTFPGYDAADLDYLEVDLNLYYGGFRLEYAHSNDYINTSETGQYAAINYSHAITETVSLDLHAGYNFGDYWKDLDIGTYSDYSITVTGAVAGMDVSLGYLFNDVDSGMDVDNGPFQNDETVLLSISRSF